MKRTLYEVLGVDPTASSEEIAAAYQKRVEELQAAPSRDNSAIALARDAHDILSDSYLRGNYDASLNRTAGVRTTSQDENDEQANHTLRARKWAIGIGVLLLICIVWLSTRGSGSGLKAVPAQLSVAPAALTPPEAATAEDESSSRSPKDVFNEVSPSVVRVAVMDAGSSRVIDSLSGVVVEPNVVITNCHVAVRGTTLGVRSKNEVRPATVQVADEQLNLCRLHVPGLDAPPANISSVWALRPGQRVVAIGAPVSGEASMRDGVVAALAQVEHGTIIESTAPISPGWSGGGLFDFSGHLVGIATFHHSYGPKLNVALPADWIRQMQARTISTPNAAQAHAIADNQDVSAGQIAGRWVCFGSIPGRNGDYTFRDDGRVLVTASEGTPSDSRYAVTKRTLQFDTGAQRTAFNIESFSPIRMVWQLGADNRVVCDRR